MVAAGDPKDHGNDGGNARDRRNDAHRPCCGAAVVRVEAERPRDASGYGEKGGRVCRSVAAGGDDDRDRNEAANFHVEEGSQGAERPPLERPEEIRKPPRQARAQREDDCHEK